MLNRSPKAKMVPFKQTGSTSTFSIPSKRLLEATQHATESPADPNGPPAFPDAMLVQNSCRDSGNTVAEIFCIVSKLNAYNIPPRSIFIGQYYTTIMCTVRMFNCPLYIVVDGVKCENRWSGLVTDIARQTSVPTTYVTTSSQMPVNTNARIEHVMYNSDSFQICFDMKAYGTSVNVFTVTSTAKPFMYAPGILYSVIDRTNPLPFVIHALRRTLTYVQSIVAIKQPHLSGFLRDYLGRVEQSQPLDWHQYESICKQM